MSQKIGLALGGGGARGWAHIGVLRALEEHSVPISYLAGTSIGALVGAIYLRGALQQLEDFADDIEVDTLLELIDISFPDIGLIQGDRVRDFLSSYLADDAIEDCPIPFRCVATNFLSKREVVLTSGSLVNAVRASISLPGVFSPFSHEDTYLVDGGVVNPVPVSVVRNMGAEAIIAVNLNSDPETERPQSRVESTQRELASSSQSPKSETGAPDASNQAEEEGFVDGLVDRYQHLKAVLANDIDDWMPDPETGVNIFDVIGNSINMMEQQVTRVNLTTDTPDVLIEPDLMKFGIFDFQNAQPMIQIGYEAAMKVMPEIEKLMDDVSANDT